MSDVPPLVVPDKRVVAGCRVADVGVTLFARRDVLGKFRDMAVVESQCDVTGDLSVLDDRGGPANDALKALTNRVFLASVGRLLGFEGDTGLRCGRGGVRADDLGADIGADKVGNVDFTGF